MRSTSSIPELDRLLGRPWEPATKSVLSVHRPKIQLCGPVKKIQAVPETRIEWGWAESRAHLIRRLAAHLADEILAGRLSHAEARRMVRKAGL
jgi:hypothetical protein